ncbi:F-BOX/RNI SUPERFAMILY PROTEIN-RELATED [Salix koriyanagi]|uniref:F-BOX/RNI SUPERFAMILY PROTEIN-RELATED n=1 Tax=Salix koriyanagi TaxID=2511006 RepID=A0A9Q1AM15_9ROSI|nr:F-BOX/RNI SUPERFAMILY PROTEIN-RELATED [Salix koriyanagi]
MTEFNRRKRCKIANEDIFERLPDEILHCILSLLPTKYAACTSVLSRRWRDEHRWTSALTNLDLDDTVMLYGKNKPCRDGKLRTPAECKAMFKKFVDRCFNLRRTVPHPMQKFRLRLSGRYRSSRVDEWIFSAIRARVEEMIILAEDTEFRLFSSETLVVFKVSCHQIYFHVYPSTVSFPRLKILHLDCLSSAGDNACIERVLSASPVLEELIIEMEECKPQDSLNVRSRSLKRLTIQFLPAFDYLDDDDPLAYRILTLDTPSLELLKLADSASEELNILHKRFSLEEATVSLGHPPVLTKKIDDYAETVVGFFGMISDVRVLALSDLTMENLKDAHELDLPCFEKFPTFWYLTRLEVEAGVDKWLTLLHILELCASLEALIFKKDNQDSTGPIRRGPHGNPVLSHCLSSCLEVIEFKNFEGQLAEIEIVEYCLRNSRVLKKMTVRYEREIDNSKEDVIQRLLNCPKGSKYAYHIEFLP